MLTVVDGKVTSSIVVPPDVVWNEPSLLLAMDSVVIDMFSPGSVLSPEVIPFSVADVLALLGSKLVVSKKSMNCHNHIEILTVIFAHQFLSQLV